MHLRDIDSYPPKHSQSLFWEALARPHMVFWSKLNCQRMGQDRGGCRHEDAEDLQNDDAKVESNWKDIQMVRPQGIWGVTAKRTGSVMPISRELEESCLWQGTHWMSWVYVNPKQSHKLGSMLYWTPQEKERQAADRSSPKLSRKWIPHMQGYSW